MPHIAQIYPGRVLQVLMLSSHVSDEFPKVPKLSSEVSECKPLAAQYSQGCRLLVEGGAGADGAGLSGAAGRSPDVEVKLAR